MKRSIGLLIVPVLLTAATFTLAGCATTNTETGTSPNLQYLGNVSQQDNGIWVSGTGTVTVTPDVAQLNIGVEFQSATVADAQGKAAQSMTAVLAAVKALGVADKDIATRNYSVSTVYSYDKATPVLVGYRVDNTVQVKVRKVADTGKIIDAAATAAGDALRINSIAFTVDQPENFYGQARQLAMADAQAKATQLASLGHVKLGAATYISENTGYNPPITYAADSSGGRAVAPSVITPVTPGDTEIQITVQVIYSIG